MHLQETELEPNENDEDAYNRILESYLDNMYGMYKEKKGLDIKELKRKKKVKVRDENLTLDDLPGGIQDKKEKKGKEGNDDDDDDDSDSEQSYEDDNDFDKELILENDKKKNRLIFQTDDSSLSKKASMWFSQEAFKDFDDEFSTKPTQSNLDDSDIEEEPERPWKIPLQKNDSSKTVATTASSKKRGIAQVDDDDSSDEETIKSSKLEALFPSVRFRNK